MLQTIKNKQELSRNVLIGSVHSLLLLPILNLLMDINKVPGKWFLFSFFIITQFSALFFKRRWHYFLFQTIMISVFLYILFPPAADFLHFGKWLRATWSIGVTQWQDLLASRLTELPVLLTLSLLFLLITLLTFLLFQFQLALPSLFSGIIYLLTLHTFTSRSVLSYLIPLVGFGFVLIAFNQINTQSNWILFATSMFLTIPLTLFLILIAYLSLNYLRPSQEWVETKSNAYQKELDDKGLFDWVNDNAIGSGFSRTGMGTDDTDLGGRLHQDFSLVFKAYTTRPQYWKVLHRTEYTGSGWKSDYDDYFESVDSPYNTWIDDPTGGNQREELLESEGVSLARLEWSKDISYLAYPYGWFDIELAESDLDYSFSLNTLSGYFAIQSEPDALSRYTVAYDETFPDRFDEETLRIDDGWREETVNTYRDLTTDDSLSELDDEDLFYLLFEEELQLPSSLPERVSELAEEITQGLDTEYDMIRAIETYLKKDSGYRYSLLDVEQTPRNGDYVDHFLFESEVGYCDNFSSAMTVLLRAVGIPARWTKGFTPGSLVVNEQGEEYFLVDNSNAHSWPEVFFPSYGWIPFEPSPSFANPVTSTEPFTSIRGETYSFSNEDVIDIGEVNDFSSTTDEVPERDEAGDVSESAEEAIRVIDEEAAEEARQANRLRWRYTFYRFSLFILIFSSFIAIFRWHTVLWLFKLLIKNNSLSSRQAATLILKLYYLKQKPHPGQTIPMYFNNWKPYVSTHTETLDRFTELADAAYYKPIESTHQLTEKQRQVVLAMLDLYPILPRIEVKSSHTYYKPR
ncbi:transglutaminase domain-containing protein [Alkalibacterium sp. f15]|uniref:transglutaminase domain-containing protein n=1 Tax=Alkalibacterium sp. f15 TaxID=3414029 RepID=UPI003BF898F6